MFTKKIHHVVNPTTKYIAKKPLHFSIVKHVSLCSQFNILFFFGFVSFYSQLISKKNCKFLITTQFISPLVLILLLVWSICNTKMVCHRFVYIWMQAKWDLSCFQKNIVGLVCEDPLKWLKANEVQFPNVRYLVHQILGIIGNQIKAKQMFCSVGILIGLYRCQLGALNINKLVLISQNLPSDPHFSLEENANESLDDFGDYEAVGVGGIIFWRLFRRFCWFWQRGTNSFKHVHYTCVTTMINLVLHFIFHCVVFLDFFVPCGQVRRWWINNLL